MNQKLPLLITIPPSHYCDKVRWAMDFLKMDFIEESSPPFFHILTTRKYGGRTTPILVTDDGIFKDSTDILKYIDSKIESPVLYPQNIRKEVEDLEEIFDKKLGPSTRRIAYYYLLDSPELIFEDFCATNHPFQDSMYETFFPLFRILIRKALKVNLKDTEKSRVRLKEVFQLVEEKLSDGRKFLTGDKITAADITFATLAAPMLMPKNYKAYKEKKEVNIDSNDNDISEKPDYIDKLPKMMAEEIKNYRNTKAGQFAEFVYTFRV